MGKEVLILLHDIIPIKKLLLSEIKVHLRGDRLAIALVLAVQPLGTVWAEAW
jgi:hypothetical protein